MKLKRILSVFVVVAMALSLVTVASAAVVQPSSDAEKIQIEATWTPMPAADKSSAGVADIDGATTYWLELSVANYGTLGYAGNGQGLRMNTFNVGFDFGSDAASDYIQLPAEGINNQGAYAGTAKAGIQGTSLFNVGFAGGPETAWPTSEVANQSAKVTLIKIPVYVKKDFTVTVNAVVELTNYVWAEDTYKVDGRQDTYLASTGAIKLTGGTEVTIPKGESVTILWGDVDGSGAINADDVAAIYKFIAIKDGAVQGKDFVIGNNYIGILWGDVDGSGAINADDVAAIYKFIAIKDGAVQGKDFVIGENFDLK